MSVHRRCVIIVGDFRATREYLSADLGLWIARYMDRIILITSVRDIEKGRGYDKSLTRISEGPMRLPSGDHEGVLSDLAYYEYLDRAKIKCWLEGRDENL